MAHSTWFLNIYVGRISFCVFNVFYHTSLNFDFFEIKDVKSSNFDSVLHTCYFKIKIITLLLVAINGWKGAEMKLKILLNFR